MKSNTAEPEPMADIAQQLGKPNAVRAVGRANATNPMPVVIPCHRVLGADGRLHGYSAPGGVETKARLLRLGRQLVDLSANGSHQQQANIRTGQNSSNNASKLGKMISG